MTEWYRRIGLELYDARRKRGWTLWDVAVALDVTAAAVSRWERGLQRMNAYYYTRLREEGLLR